MLGSVLRAINSVLEPFIILHRNQKPAFNTVFQCPEGHSDRGDYLNNLALLLGHYRFNCQGKPNDLDEAISLREEVLYLRPVGHKSRNTSLSKLRLVLVTRFDITRAVSLYREALMLHPPGYPCRDITLNNLSLALKSRHPHRDTMLKKLSLAVETRYVGLDVSEDLNEAIDCCREALWLQQYHQKPYATLSNLSVRMPMSRRPFNSAEKRWELCLHSTQTDTASISCYGEPICVTTHNATPPIYHPHFRLASRHPTHGLPSRIIEAHNWTVAAELHSTRSSPTSRREAAAVFHDTSRLPVDAASCAIRHAHIQLEDLESANPELAHKYLKLSNLISDAAQTTEYRKHTEQWEAVVAKIRDLRVFSRFLLPPSYEDLQAAARHRPVIILIASQYLYGAIIVPTSGDPVHVPLSSIILADLNDLKNRFTRAIRDASRMSPNESRTDPRVLSRTIRGEIMRPIVNVLENVLKLNRGSRIWLYPTAAFISIPLHAANPFQTNADKCGAASVSVLCGNWSAGKGKALLAVDSELELVRKLVLATVNRTTISGDEATRAGALEALEKNTWVHLTCHGKQDPAQPYHSHFVMRDEHLTLLNIMERDIPYAEFAFLSACHTAVGDGLQFSGFKSVIGTLWEVDDAVAKYIVEVFYKYMFDPKYGGVRRRLGHSTALHMR
ncbi:hypothetical protein BDR04DRAFT_1159475 [Suillus decipiens]|nr:hypothetical protein BDR04DRAFT_1159475 [Suillus decipiens]